MNTNHTSYKKSCHLFLLMALLLTASNQLLAYDFSAINADGKIINYNITSQNTVAVTSITSGYTGVINIPSTVAHSGTTYSVTSIGDTAFYDNDSLILVIIPNSVTFIGERAFRMCANLTTVSIPNSVTYIGEEAFSYCTRLSSITIPNSVTSIEFATFSHCTNLSSVSLPCSITSIDGCAFQGCTSLTTIILPDSVASIGSSAFYGCTSLTSITLPNSVTFINSSTFEACDSLCSIIIPNSVTYIGSNAFKSCSSLSSITIPNRVTYIGESAFYNCSNLSSITSRSVNPPSIANQNAFIGVNRSIPLYVPSNSMTQYSTANVWSTFTNINAIVNDDTAEVVLTVSNVTAGSFTLAIAMNEYTGTYYVGYAETDFFSDYTQSEIVQMICSPSSLYTTNGNGIMDSLTPNTSYSVYVIPYNASGVMGNISMDTVVTQTVEVTVTVSNITTNSFDISTIMNEYTGSYYFAYAETEFCSDYSQTEMVDMIVSQMTPYTTNISGIIDSLLPGTSYSLYVIPYNAYGVMGIVTIDTVVTLTPMDSGTAEVAVTISNITTNSFHIATTMNEYTDSYYFFCVETELCSYYTRSEMVDMIVSYTSPNTENISGVIDSLLPTTSYSLYVIPYDDSGSIGRITIDTIITGGSGSAEVLLTVSNITTSGFDIAATMNEHTASYYFAYAETDFCSNYTQEEMVDMIVSQMTPYTTNINGTIDDLLSGTSYSLYTIPYNASGTMGMVTIETIEILGGDDTPAEVTVTISEVTNSSFYIDIEKNAATSYFYLAVYDSADIAGYSFDQIVESIMANSAPYTNNAAGTISGLDPGTAYHSYVLPFNANREMGVHQIVSTTTEGGVVISSVESGNEVAIYPNPACNNTTIRVSGVEGEVTVTIVDMNGSIVGRYTMECAGDCEKQVNVNGLAAGNYFVHLQGNVLNAVKKLVVK